MSQLSDSVELHEQLDFDDDVLRKTRDLPFNQSDKNVGKEYRVKATRVNNDLFVHQDPCMTSASEERTNIMPDSWW